VKKIATILIFCLLFGQASALIILGSGNSMLPTFPNPCLIKVKTVPYEKLDYGMIAIFKDKANNNNLTAHKLIHKNKDGSWVTKGDNNKEPDKYPLTKKNYEGVAELLKIK
jgi:signal peptidase I